MHFNNGTLKDHHFRHYRKLTFKIHYTQILPLSNTKISKIILNVPKLILLFHSKQSLINIKSQVSFKVYTRDHTTVDVLGRIMPWHLLLSVK